MNAVVKEQQINALLNGIDIPPAPRILMDLQRELAKDEADQREIAKLISQDVALSGHVMAVANSPAFSGGKKFVSIIQALNVLGTSSVFNLVIGQLLRLALGDATDQSLERFWETSARTAALSAELAKRLRCVRPDVAYTFGLFHDCGIPLLTKRFPNTKAVLTQANACADRLFTDVEDELLGTNHAVVGYFLARRWSLPDFVVEAILNHHDYSVLVQDGRVSDTARGLIAVCVLAEHVIRLHANGDGEKEWEKAAERACAYFGLSLGVVDDLIEDMRDWLG